MNTKEFHLEVKGLTEAGTFEGYASTFGGSPDSYGDIITPGAFAETLVKHRREGTMPMMFFGHKSSDEPPIGDWLEMAEDGKGLWAKGQLELDDPEAARIHRHLKAKRIRGLSIGYETRKSRPDEKRPGITHLDEIHLWEVSVVNFPANRRSLVIEAKATDPAQWWALHDRLREIDESSEASSELKKEIEGMLQIEACPKSLRPFFAKRLVGGGLSESGHHPPHRSESEGTKSAADTLRAFVAGLGG